jgi:hypothetical protein
MKQVVCPDDGDAWVQLPRNGGHLWLPYHPAFRLRGAPKRRFGATAASRMFVQAAFFHANLISRVAMHQTARYPPLRIGDNGYSSSDFFW